jgi:glycosyltransferase involved in cell wall biosynthesis
VYRNKKHKIMKILHIHSDKKFISETLRYQYDNINNTIVLLSNEDIELDLEIKRIRFRLNFLTLKKVLSYSEGFDLVVLYDLNTYHIAIANALSPEIKIIWRFFGQELYRLDKQAYLSDYTKKINNASKSSFFNKVKASLSYRIKRQVYSLFYGYNFNLFQAISRISYMMVLFKEEYDLLSKKYALPPFLQIPLNHIELKRLNGNENKILLGNSKNDFNNHLDVLHLLKEIDTSNCIIPLNYGTDSYYAERVLQEARDQKISVLNTFLPYSEYEDLLASCSTFVLNSYRQMAVGNILLALKNGMKIYLHQNNLVYHIFKIHDIRVFTIEEFSQDVVLGDLSISKNIALHNIEKYNGMVRSSKSEFLRSLAKIDQDLD